MLRVGRRITSIDKVAAERIRVDHPISASGRPSIILNRRWLKYRLRTLMLVILVVGLSLTAWRRMQEHEQTVVVLAKAKHLEPALEEPRWIDRVTHADLRQVTRASFHGVETIGDKELAQLRRCAGLKRLSLYRTSVTDEGMATLQAFTGLRALSLEHTAVTDAGLEHLAGLGRLEELQLSHSKVQGPGLQHLRELRQLRKLAINFVPIVDEDLRWLRHATEMRELSLRGVEIDGSSLQILQQFHKLEYLEIRSDKLRQIRVVSLPNLASVTLDGKMQPGGELVVQDLPACTKLSLGLSAWEARPKIVIADLPQVRYLLAPAGRTIELRNLPQVKELRMHLYNCERLTLNDLPALHKLSVENTGLTEQNVAEIAKLTSLVHLDMRDTRLDDAWMAPLSSLERLEVLDLWASSINGSGLAFCRDLPKLRSLALDMTRTDDHALANLAGVTSLEKLTLFRTQITDAGLVHLKELRNLKELSLQQNAIEGPGLADIGGLTKLQSLAISTTQIADAHLVYLADLENLQQLSIAGTRVSDRGVEHLTRLKSLRSLNVFRTQLTNDGVRWLQEALPECRITSLE